MPGYPNLGSVTGGMVDTTLDLQSIQMNNLKTQQEAIGLQRDKIALAQDMRMMQLMQGVQFHPSMGGPGQPSTPNDMTGLLTQMSEIAMMSGKVDQAAKLAGDASRIQENSSKIDYRQFRMQSDRLNKFANVLGAVADSPEGYVQALQTIMTEDPRAAADPKFQQLARTPWKPGLIPMLKAQVLTQKESAEIKYRNAAEEHARSAATVDEHRVNLIDAQTKLANDRDRTLKKTGAIPVKSEQLRAITDQATRDYPSADPADIRVRSRPLAEEMVRMVRDQHLTESEAAARVYENARSSGTFSGLRQAPILKGSKPGAALPLPAKAEQMKENMWYTIRGVPMLKVGEKLYTEEELAGMDSDEKEALGLDDSEDDENPDDSTPAK